MLFRSSDRFGILRPVLGGTVALSLGFVLAALSGNLWQFALAQSLLIGMLGSSATFAPLIADISLWFVRRRGVAVALCASGNYLAGTIWPPIVQHFTDTVGWRTTYLGIALFCAVTMLPLSLLLRRKPPALRAEIGSVDRSPASMEIGRASCRERVCSTV